MINTVEVVLNTSVTDDAVTVATDVVVSVFSFCSQYFCLHCGWKGRSNYEWKLWLRLVV